MNKFLVLIACVGFVAAEPLHGISASQYRYQDELGQHAFGHVGGPNSREEVKTADGVTRGSYSYVDGHGLVQSAVYAADAAGFRVAATNLPVGPAVPAGEEHIVAAAPSVVAAHSLVAAPALAHAPAVLAARTILPGVPHAALIHSLKKRDLIAVARPLTSYPGSTAPLVHSVPVVPTPLIAHTPYVAHTSYLAAPLTHVLKKRSLLLAPGSLAVPLDTPEVAHAKAASLVQQNTEALRNAYGGIPLALPADTPEVAAGKIAHSIAHARASVHPALVSPYLHVLKKRSVLLAQPWAYTTAIHPGSLNVPLDEPIVAHAKAANLIQQNSEALRNNARAIPLVYPADTPEVSAAKVAHSVAHAHQAASVSHPILYL